MCFWTLEKTHLIIVAAFIVCNFIVVWLLHLEKILQAGFWGFI